MYAWDKNDVACGVYCMNIHKGIVPCADRCSLLCSVFMPYAIAVEAEAFAVTGYRLADLRHERQDGSLRIA